MLASPVVEVVAASSTTGRLESGLRLTASSMPLTTWSMVTPQPLRGIKPWLASELSIGHGLRPGEWSADDSGSEVEDVRTVTGARGLEGVAGRLGDASTTSREGGEGEDDFHVHGSGAEASASGAEGSRWGEQ